MRALLVTNPRAGRTSPRAREVIARAFDSEVELDVVETTSRGHATALAKRAAAGGLDLVIALGGDGTVTEVVNGLLGDGSTPRPPALGIVPGGTTNVLARSLGIGTSPVEAAGAVLDAVRTGRRRSIGLGRLTVLSGVAGRSAGEEPDGRWFTINAGMGLDAEVIGHVERRRREGALASSGLYLREGVRTLVGRTDRRRPALTLEVPGADPVVGLFLAIVANSDPWTYLGKRAVRPCPEASFDAGLDVYGLRRLRTVSILQQVHQLLSEAPGRARGRHAVRRHDLADLTLRADRPVDLQVDGEHLGRATAVRLESVPAAVEVLV